MDLLDHFPKEYTPRDGQIKVINQIEKALQDKKKFIILNANTGFGKSMIPKTLGSYSKDPSSRYVRDITSYDAFKKDEYGSYKSAQNDPEFFGVFALTISKNLQDQYLKDFTNSGILKGRRNYQCKFDEEFDVESGPCVLSNKLLNECWGCNRCTYYNARNETLINKFSILNYSVFLTLPDHLKYRQFLVLDEASELEDEIVKRYTVTLKYSDLDRVGVIYRKLTSEDSSQVRNWLTDIYDEVKIKAEYFQDLILKKKKSKLADSIKLKYLKNLQNNLDQVVGNWASAEYLSDFTDETVLIQPYRVNKLSNNIFQYGETIVLMSATIIDHQHYAESLGIPKSDYVYIEADNTFDPQKSPIYASGKYPLTYKLLNENLPHVAELAKTICDNHAHDKGLIHTGNFRITEYLKNALSSGRFLYREDTTKNEDIINIHENIDTPTVLISPSMTHGVDLRGDLGRFQIIMKIPYLPINDKRIKKLMDNDFRWYQNKMLSTLMQACGRCTRSVDDYSTTYIIDGAIMNVLKYNRKKLPQYFIDRLV